MVTKALAFLVLASVANGNDVIVGLKTDGTKFFDENRQANPALWRQMDNVTIKAPENEVIRRVVITDLRPDKDGDVKIVDGGEGQKNVTIELKSPTVLRGYEFHIEVYSIPEENVPFPNDQQSTTENVKDDSTAAFSNPTTNFDTTSKLPELTTDKISPAIISIDEVQNSEREGRNVKNEEKTTNEGVTELTSTTFKSVSTTPTTLLPESVTESRSEKSSDTTNKPDFQFTSSPIPLDKNLHMSPVVPAIDGIDSTSGVYNGNGSDDARHVRDTEKEKLGKLNPTIVGSESSTENNEEASTTEMNDATTVEENSEDKRKENDTTGLKFPTFNNRKYTSIISTKVEQPNGKDASIQRNVRGAIEEQKVDGSTITPFEATTTDINVETSTPLDDDCITTEANVQSPVNIGKDNTEDKTDQLPTYLNNRQWNQLNNPAFQQNTPGIKIYPAVLTNDQSTLSPENTDAERVGVVGTDYKSSPDHMENRNPKISAIASNRNRDFPSTQ